MKEMKFFRFVLFFKLKWDIPAITDIRITGINNFFNLNSAGKTNSSKAWAIEATNNDCLYSLVVFNYLVFFFSLKLYREIVPRRICEDMVQGNKEQAAGLLVEEGFEISCGPRLVIGKAST